MLPSIRLLVCLVLFTTGLAACVELVDLPLRQTERRLVVDGLITDEAPPYLIKLTYSGNLRNVLLVPDEVAVNGAIATVTDDEGRSVRLEQDPVSPAFYWLRDPDFRGRPGRSYTLSVTLPDGARYQSRPELLRPVPPLDSIYAVYRRGALAQPDFYDIRINTQDPATAGDYYRWAALGYLRRWAWFDPQNPPYFPMGPPCCTSCWVPYFGSLGDVLSDNLINGRRIAGRLIWSAPIYAVGAQYVQVRQFSLTRSAYQYWQRFEQQASRSGSLFDAQPASIEGNVRAVDDTTRLALGYFGASAVSQRRLTIPGDTINYNRFLARFGKQFIPDGKNCFAAYQQAQLVPPQGWPAR